MFSIATLDNTLLEVLELNWILDLLQSKNYPLAAWLHNLTIYDQNSSNIWPFNWHHQYHNLLLRLKILSKQVLFNVRRK